MPLGQLLVEKRRSTKVAVRHQCVVRDDAHAQPACAFVEALRLSSRYRVEHEHRFSCFSSGRIDGFQQARCDSLSPRVAAHQHFRDICSVRLVFRLCNDQLHRANDKAFR